jgi:hypothetical protein
MEYAMAARVLKLKMYISLVESKLGPMIKYNYIVGRVQYHLPIGIPT